MNTKKLMVAVMLASFTGAMALDAADARLRPRARRAADTAATAAVVSTAGDPEERQDNRSERQDYRQDQWNNASPNQKAVTYNVAKSRHQQKLTRQAAGASALSKRRGN